jgi:hypothetical protein
MGRDWPVMSANRTFEVMLHFTGNCGRTSVLCSFVLIVVEQPTRCQVASYSTVS